MELTYDARNPESKFPPIEQLRPPAGAPVSPDYGAVGNRFQGELKGVLLSIADDPNNSDPLVTPEQALRAALGRQST